MNFCPKCGQKRLGKFCGGCGFSFGETSSSPMQVEATGKIQEEFSVPHGLSFGDKFDPKKNCQNCGAKSPKADLCPECE